MPGSSWWFSQRHSGLPGASADRYASFNLATHVGDEPAAVAANRRELSRLSGDRPVTFMDQVHSATVTVLDAPRDVDVPATDALVTTTPDLALAVLVADCVPLLLHAGVHDGRPAVAAAVHAGRAGILAGVVGATLRTIADLGVQIPQLSAAIGPAIGGCCYEVPQQMQDEVGAFVPQARSTTRRGSPSLDLRTAVVGQLLAAGVADIHLRGGCTYDDEQSFSYRRDGVTGRFAGVVVLSP